MDKNKQIEAESLKRRFQQLKAETGIGRAQFARDHQVPGGERMIYQHINAIKPISLSAARAYAKGFNCTWEEISPTLAEELSLSDNGQSRESLRQSLSNVSPAQEIKGRIPLISTVKAGMWDESVDIYEPGYAERWLPFIKASGDNTYALRVDGDSMTAPYGRSYPDGSIIFVDPQLRAPSNGDRIIAKLIDQNEVVFKVFVTEAGRTWLKPLNPQHPPIFDPFTVIGTVTGMYIDG